MKILILAAVAALALTGCQQQLSDSEIIARANDIKQRQPEPPVPFPSNSVIYDGITWNDDGCLYYVFSASYNYVSLTPVIKPVMIDGNYVGAPVCDVTKKKIK
jgi:hypothetical protein